MTDIMLQQLFRLENMHDFRQGSYYLNRNFMKPLYSYIQPFSFLENDFCSPNLFLFSRVSERTGKSRVLEGKIVWVDSLGFLR